MILIAGPTASGKSALAMALARQLGGVIVNADSMQVYRDLRILSARPTPADEEQVEHALYGYVDAAEAYSTGKWLAAATAEIDRAASSSRPAILAGGTGLYFRALEQGLAVLPPIPGETRERWRARLASLGPVALHAELARSDPPLAARIAATDGQRLVRALEVLEATGRSLLDWQAETARGGPLADARVARLLLTVNRSELYARCDRRFDDMMAEGAIEEAATLKARRLDPQLPAMKALGVAQLIAYLNGDSDLNGAVAAAKTLTRRYAKRQLTWFRSNMISWTTVATHDSKTLMPEILSHLDDLRLTDC